MTEPREVNIETEFDSVALLSPLIAGHLLNAFYSALLVKKQSGTEITKEIEDEILLDVLDRWAKFQQVIEEKVPRKKVRLGGVRYQSPER